MILTLCQLNVWLFSIMCLVITECLDSSNLTLYEKVDNKGLLHTNEKWFLNLSSKTVPLEVSNLLQLGEGFSLPIYKDKGIAAIEFIKDIEGKELRHNNK